MTTIDTRERLLNAAERLFAQNGIGNTSLRAVTAEASTNLASVHYHFGSKGALISAVFARRFGPLNRERLRLLADAGAGDTPPRLEDIIEAFVAPALHLIHDPERGGKYFMCLMAQVHADTGELSSIVMAQLDEVIVRFSAALYRALPELPRADVLWRFAFTIGSMAFVLGHAETLKDMSGSLCDPSDAEGTLKQLVAFAAAGMRAPALNSTGDPE